MAVTTTLKRGYAWRIIIIAVVSGVLGLWGVYDYLVAIPRKAEAHKRSQIYAMVKDALGAQPSAEARAVTVEAHQAVDDELKLIFEGELGRAIEGETLSKDDIARLEEVIQARQEESWFRELLLFLAALDSTRPPGDELTGIHLVAYEAAELGTNELGSAEAPGKYDRITQWAFISCLPFAPYFIWVFFRTRKQVYTLDDDGTLHMPEGVWKTDDIADIDMSRWMAKSIAYAVHRDGTRAKLDDYKFHDLHLIIGAISHRFHPDKWDAEAKPIKEGSPQQAAEAAPDTPKPAAAEPSETAPPPGPS